MNKTKFVTSIYCDLHGTDLGGRPSRGSHYRYSLKSLLKMTEADFVCYTSDREIDSLKEWFFKENGVTEDRVEFKIFDLRNFIFSEKINALKNVEQTKSSHRCIEIQYSKFIWSYNEFNIGDYENVYWIDAGLSHSGIIPDKYLFVEGGWGNRYFESSLFNNKFLNNLINFTGDKVLNLAKDNLRNYWSGTVPQKYYKQHCQDRHIIGGLFGGKKDKFKNYCELFFDYTNKLLDDKYLYQEENIMSLIYYNHPELFVSKYFDTWWHEDERMPGIDDMKKFTEINKSFYKMLEELNE